jgi:hypothetical protein
MFSQKINYSPIFQSHHSSATARADCAYRLRIESLFTSVSIVRTMLTISDIPDAAPVLPAPERIVDRRVRRCGAVPREVSGPLRLREHMGERARFDGHGGIGAITAYRKAGEPFVILGGFRCTGAIYYRVRMQDRTECEVHSK